MKLWPVHTCKLQIQLYRNRSNNSAAYHAADVTGDCIGSSRIIDVHETMLSRKRLLQHASPTALQPVERLTVAEQINSSTSHGVVHWSSKGKLNWAIRHDQNICRATHESTRLQRCDMKNCKCNAAHNSRIIALAEKNSQDQVNVTGTAPHETVRCLRWGCVFLERTRILSEIQFTTHSIEFFVVETKRFVGSFVHVILTRQTCGQRSSKAQKANAER